MSNYKVHVRKVVEITPRREQCLAWITHTILTHWVYTRQKRVMPGGRLKYAESQPAKTTLLISMLQHYMQC